MKAQVSKVSVYPTSVVHIENIARKMRVEEGVEEVGLDKCQILETAVRKSLYSFCAKVDGEVACIWGIQPNTMLSDSAYMWLVTTPLVEKHSFIFARRSQIYMEGLRNYYADIYGHVDIRFRRSVRWLNWLGFVIGEADESSLSGTFLRPFALRQK